MLSARLVNPRARIADAGARLRELMLRLRAAQHGSIARLRHDVHALLARLGECSVRPRLRGLAPQ